MSIGHRRPGGAGLGDQFLQVKGTKVLAAPEFIAASVMAFAKSSSAWDCGQIRCLFRQPEVRKDSCLSMNSLLKPCLPKRTRASCHAAA